MNIKSTPTVDLQLETTIEEQRKIIRLINSKREKWGTGETCALQRGFILLPSLSSQPL